jgi:hypothetical protein
MGFSLLLFLLDKTGVSFSSAKTAFFSPYKLLSQVKELSSPSIKQKNTFIRAIIE